MPKCREEQRNEEYERECITNERDEDRPVDDVDMAQWRSSWTVEHRCRQASMAAEVFFLTFSLFVMRLSVMA
jgi:hypothetical protein